ncbi:Zinc finger protein [Pseudolycoriella hygida]|uniref:Zinc finger protein n=1 Tax=Pseudolycoriella hygida TaxID=35572 RepID=A0A9Q0MRJ5_9DIPT|nr:Zinc finger protein [Pseudolycoriella hygida]
MHQAQSQQEYKPVPFNKFPQYFPHPSSVNSSVSPRNVTSSSPTHNSGIQSSISSPSNQLIPTNQATPSPSSNQCDKCGHICETASQLSEHYATSHGSSLQNEASRNAGVSEDNEISSFPYNPYIKEEQPCDILDLDSQKMVYSPNDDHSQQGPLPPMHSLHHLQRPLIWQEHHALPYTQDIKPTLYPTIQPKQDFVPTMKQDYIHHQSQIGHQTPDVKQFASDVTGNQVTSSPSEFPSTTTPQENGGHGEKPYKCQKCGKRFACGPSHELHLSKHSAVKPFQCSRCVKSFNHKTDLRRHMCLHDGIKPFTCPTCGKGFIRKDHMMKHTETHTRKSANLAKKQVFAKQMNNIMKNVNKLIETENTNKRTMESEMIFHFIGFTFRKTKRILRRDMGLKFDFDAMFCTILSSFKLFVVLCECERMSLMFSMLSCLDFCRTLADKQKKKQVQRDRKKNFLKNKKNKKKTKIKKTGKIK